ncbi:MULTISPECIES: TetR/AcrR family transcriptional regulator [unclassified Oceanispirochaeta]|uniref:TetR/AcrR family transcriptional regulator n=1 Tax=unclassified Oceanispirochaeta TaxID=2635722 RepID=UPI000E0970B5|nr:MULTISPECIES: TetR/AcrR family transcriptional regulator [unclassified Oceanispirochaeta]MBF9018346.1 TetR/AcrR family transcriptional regulator [Oceanispirochaeta sp. M2]NPD74811.1 TetR/AcrR family transcriptional regulator [Oceanispirochaeta sp. M1]RDG29364.1 TetR/AcrR family transcriptional regulator [Oceanispirochaeta sp. M1]
MKVEEKRRLKKIAIMEAAMDAWSCDDYKKTSLTTLAKELQMTKPALYRYFSNKEELLNSMAEYVNSLEREWFLELIPRLQSMKKDDQTRFFIESYSKAQVESKRYVHFSSYNTLRQNKLFQLNNMKQIIEIQKILNISNRVFLLIMLYCFFMWGWHENEELQQNRTDIEKIDLILNLLNNGLAGESFRLPSAEKAETTAEIYKQYRMCSNQPDLIQAVNQVIQEKGFTGVTLELIAEKAGMSKSTLYNYFKNKDDMLTKTINALVTDYTKFHAQLLSQKDSFEDKLLAHLELQSVLFPQKPQAFIVLKQFMSPEIFGKIKRPALKKGFLDFLQEGIDNKKLKDILSVYEYQMIFSFFIFIERVIYQQEGDAPLTEEILDWLKLLAYGKASSAT